MNSYTLYFTPSALKTMSPKNDNCNKYSNKVLASVQKVGGTVEGFYAPFGFSVTFDGPQSDLEKAVDSKIVTVSKGQLLPTLTR